jgi:AcrR family transcriptional regulator
MGAAVTKSRRNDADKAADLPVRTVKSVTRDQPLVRERRDKLINAAIQVVKENGFHAATIRDIGRAAGMTQGTIYNYVSSKDDILFLVCDRLVTEYQEETRKALETIADPLDRVRSGARAVARVIYEHQEEILLIFQNGHLLDKRSLRVILARVDGFVRLFEKFIRDAAQEANIRIGNSYLAANIFTYLPTIVALRRWSLGRELSQDEILSGLTDFLVRGLGFPAASDPLTGRSDDSGSRKSRAPRESRRAKQQA